jgi:site-specific recombinase XerD
LLRQGVSPLVLRDLLGHESLEMVLIYAHVVAAHLQEEMARVTL